jgi:hypothetical protein
MFFCVDLHEKKIQNRLTMHLELTIQMFGEKFFTLQDFPFRETNQS